MKKIEINGKEYRRKYLMQLCIKNGKGFSVRQKDILAYDVAVAYTRDDKGNGKWYSVMDMKDFSAICYDEDARMVDIVFRDEEAKRHWDKVFVYLSDDLGALLFMADRTTIHDGGCRLISKMASGVAEVRTEALIYASLLDKALFGKILQVEKYASERAEADMLRLEG